jgi:hypothetical protein
MRYRKLARYTWIRKRFGSLTSNELHVALKWRRLGYRTLIAAKYLFQTSPDDMRIPNAIEVGRECLRRYLVIVLEHPQFYLAPPQRLHRTIATFGEDVCKQFFAFLKADLFRLFAALRMPPQMVRLEDGSVMPGEEMFLRSLYEFVSGEDQFNICENVFGREQSTQSRAFKYFVDHVYSHFIDLVSDNLQ